MRLVGEIEYWNVGAMPFRSTISLIMPGARKPAEFAVQKRQ